MHDVWLIGDWDDIETSLLEEIANGEFNDIETMFTAKRDNRGYLYAHVLTPNASQPIEMRDGGFENVKDLQERVHRRYGQEAVFMSASKFQQEIAQRQIHTPELVALLWQQGDLLGIDNLTGHVVYGAPMRPMSSIWARIDGAVFIPADKQRTGYHSYVAVPAILDKEIVEKYELMFVSRPQ